MKTSKPKDPTAAKRTEALKERLQEGGMNPRIKQSKTYGQIATGLTISVLLAFPFSMNLAAALLFLATVFLLTGLAFHKHDE